ncbi:MAG: type II toxin-antitoxin system HicA family toxin [SAR202 cluster bacterium]|nr:type II toxin-antitoxin system HicA family toxin [SAR202 cluster bacterium]
MKRRALIRHLLAQGCVFLREGAKHSLYFNPKNQRTSAIPGHTEIAERLARKICRDLSVDAP